MEISERLKEIRQNAGMTQEEVAEKIMVSRVTVSHWENGKSLPDIVSLISLSDLYSISLDELLKGDSKMTEKVKKDAKEAKNNKRLIGITAILVIAVLLVYGVSIIVGGGFKDFCEGAIWWVLIAIGLAASMTYHVLLWKDKFRIAALSACIILADLHKKKALLRKCFFVLSGHLHAAWVAFFAGLCYYKAERRRRPWITM